MDKRICKIDDRIQKSLCDIITKSTISMNFLIIDSLKEENINFQFSIDKLGKVDRVRHFKNKLIIIQDSAI